MQLRDYQIDALKTINHDLKQNDNPVLLQASCGAGKTVIICKLIERYFNMTNRTFLILAHKQELITQAYNSFEKFTDISKSEIGVVCAGLGKREFGRRITLSTVQTYSHVESPAPCSLLVIDEVHKVSVGTGSQYDQIVNRLNALTPNFRVLGVTATPSRLGHGYIYGDRHAPGKFNLFKRLNFKIKYETLRDLGYLVPLKGKVSTNKSLTEDLERVNINGDYVLQELGDTMSQARHLQTAVEAIQLYVKDYKKICCFCVTIDHAEQLQKLIGNEATIVHSKLMPTERFENMQAWKSGSKRIITSVAILAEGFDLPELDCLVMVRPTMSSSLYLQVVGRVLRTYPGKDHGFILDLTNNTSYFGTDLDRIKITIPKSVQIIADKATEMIKLCPSCEREIHVVRRECICGYKFPEKEFEIADSIPDMEDVEFVKPPPKWIKIDKQIVTEHTGRKSNKRLGRLILISGENIYKPTEYSIWFCLPDFYRGYALEQSQKKWAKISENPFPQTVDEFLETEFETIAEVLLDDNGDYPEIKDFRTVPF